MSKRSINVHVEADNDRLAQRFVDAWHRAERSERVAETHLSFESWESLSKVLTAKRLELLRHLHRNRAGSVAELARALGRDYKRVHEDVEALAAAGLIDRNEHGLTAGYEEIRATIAM